MRLPRSWSRLYQYLRYQSLSGELLRLLLRRKKVVLEVAGNCRCCGRCCRSLSLEGPRGWLRSPQQFRTLQQQREEYSRFVIEGRDSHGFLLFSCSMLNDDGRCADYENRPSLCRDYPHPELPYSGGALFDGCGYYFTQNRSFAALLKEKQANIKAKKL